MTQLALKLNPVKLSDNLVVERIGDLPIIAVSINFLSGTYLDSEETIGLTRLTWLTALRHPRDVPYKEFHEILEANGIEFSVSVNREVAELSLRCVPDKLSLALEMILKLLAEPSLLEEDLEEVRRVTLNSIKAERDDLMTMLSKLVNKSALDFPYSAPILGEEEVIKGISLDDLSRTYPRLIRASFSIASAGALSPQEEKVLLDFLESLKELGAKPSPSRPTEARFKPRRLEDKLDKLQSGIAVTFPAPPIDNEDEALAFGIVRRALSSMSSRLFIELREKMSLAYEVGSIYKPYFGTGILTGYMTTAKDKLEIALRRLREELELLPEEPLTNEEIERAKQYSLGTYLRRLQYRSSIASSYSYNTLTGLPLERITNYVERVQEVTPEKIHDLLKKYLRGTPAVAVVL